MRLPGSIRTASCVRPARPFTAPAQDRTDQAAAVDRRRTKWFGQDIPGAAGCARDLAPCAGRSINPDDVARELAGGHAPSPEQSLQAAQLCDARLDAEIAAGRSVTIETVLSSDKLKHRVEAAKAADFDIALVYVTVRDGALNVARVEQRHAQGGHDVPADKIFARRTRSHALFEWFARQADMVLVFDNTGTPIYAAGKAPGDMGSGGGRSTSRGACRNDSKIGRLTSTPPASCRTARPVAPARPDGCRHRRTACRSSSCA
jgi:predicted ABC-type ATPase